MFKSTVLLCASTTLLTMANANVVHLTEETFDKEIKHKKAMVKFTSTDSEWEHAVKPEWDKLAEYYKNHYKILIAEVDCDKSEEYCKEKFEIEHFPSIMYFMHNTQGEYHLGRDFNAMRKFVHERLGIDCDIHNLHETCTEDDKDDMRAYSRMSHQERHEHQQSLKDMEKANRKARRQNKELPHDQDEIDRQQHLVKEMHAAELVNDYLTNIPDKDWKPPKYDNKKEEL